jgi:hypothetical protein
MLEHKLSARGRKVAGLKANNEALRTTGMQIKSILR